MGGGFGALLSLQLFVLSLRQKNRGFHAIKSCGAGGLSGWLNRQEKIIFEALKTCSAQNLVRKRAVIMRRDCPSAKRFFDSKRAAKRILLIAFFLTAPAHGSEKKTLDLSEKYVLKEVLSSSPFIQKLKITNQKKQSSLLEKKYSLSSWTAFSSWTQAQKSNPEIFIFEGKKVQNKNFALGLKKDIQYGLSLSSAYSQQSRVSDFSGFLEMARAPKQIYTNNLSLELKASLSSALSQRWALKAIGIGQTASQWLYYEQAEELALQAAGQYWKAYLAWISSQQAKESAKTYRLLVQQANSKKKYGFLKPGERPQILAEYENIKQKADRQGQIYEDEKKALLLLLKKDPRQYDVRFKREKPSPIPRFPKMRIESARSVKIAQAQIEDQTLKLNISRISLFPSLELSGKGGLIPGASSPENLRFSANQSFYEAGLSLKWILFSPSFYEKAHQEKYTLEENKIDLEILKQELKNKLSSLKKSMAISYKNVHRAQLSNSYQKQAFKELRDSFSQGRVDIFELIRAESKLRESAVKKEAALSEYSLLLLQLLALRDQLVEDYFKP